MADSISRLTYAANTWHEVIPGINVTQITHNSGLGQVVYTESDTEPPAYNSNVPVNNMTEITDNIYFTNVGADSIWFYPIKHIADITITKA